MDEFRQNRDRNRNLHEQVGDINRVDNFQELVRGKSQNRGEDSEAVTPHEIESTKSSSMAAAQSSSGIVNWKILDKNQLLGYTHKQRIFIFNKEIITGEVVTWILDKKL